MVLLQMKKKRNLHRCLQYVHLYFSSTNIFFLSFLETSTGNQTHLRGLGGRCRVHLILRRVQYTMVQRESVSPTLWHLTTKVKNTCRPYRLIGLLESHSNAITSCVFASVNESANQLCSRCHCSCSIAGTSTIHQMPLCRTISA